MDMPSLRTDVDQALRALPKEVVCVVIGLLMKYQSELTSIIPTLIPLLKPHVMAGVIEHQVGVLTLSEVSEALTPVLNAYLMDVTKEQGVAANDQVIGDAVTG